MFRLNARISAVNRGLHMLFLFSKHNLKIFVNETRISGGIF